MSPTSISGGGKLLTGGELISPASLKRQEEVLPTAKLEQRRYNKFGRMTDGKFISDEHAVKVDYPFGEQADKLYFNYKAIAEWLSRQ